MADLLHRGRENETCFGERTLDHLHCVDIYHASVSESNLVNRIQGKSIRKKPKQIDQLQGQGLIPARVDAVKLLEKVA